MISILKPAVKDAPLLSVLAEKSFVESHGHSAAQEDIANFVVKNYNQEALLAELSDPGNIFHIIYHQGQAAGYSKIIFDVPPPGNQKDNVTKLERIYLLKEFYGMRLGFELLQHNITIARNSGQQGMWLFVWKENVRAFEFYKKAGFVVIGNHDFRISATHTNPNYIMLLDIS